MFPSDTSPDPSAILPTAHSPVSPLDPPLAVDPFIDQTSPLPPAAPHVIPLTPPPIDSSVPPQEPAPPVDPVTNQTYLLPLRCSNRVRAPPAHLRNYSCFSTVISLHEPHTYRKTCTNLLWQ